jgi:hypothetical protein
MRARARTSRKNPVSSGSQTNWAMVGLGVLVVGGLGFAAYSYYQGSSWPPSASVQQGVLSQVLAANTAMGGTPPTADDSAQLNAAIAQAPATYAATLPAGASPTVAGYQAWASNWIISYIQGAGSSGGIANAQLSS